MPQKKLIIFLLINITPPCLLIVWMARLMTHSTWLGNIGMLCAFMLMAPLLTVAGNILARMALRRLK